MPLGGGLAPFALLGGGADAEGVGPAQFGLATRRSVGSGPCDWREEEEEEGRASIGARQGPATGRDEKVRHGRHPGRAAASAVPASGWAGVAAAGVGHGTAPGPHRDWEAEGGGLTLDSPPSPVLSDTRLARRRHVGGRLRR